MTKTKYKMKVFYNSGNNIDFNYFIVGEKNQKTLDEKSLVSKLTDEKEIEILDIEIDGKRYTSNQDYLIKEVEIATQRVKRYFTCNKTDIQF
ncbi:hypothetical protein BWK60_13260 [Flavobacterium covae]|nr:hypothetical protein BWK60_13260 [Flavobacterium covae]